jgi:flagellar motor protein MotB
MKNDLHFNRVRRKTGRFYFVFLVAISTTFLSTTGCRQPVANSPRTSLFGSGGNSLFANNSRQQQSYVGNQPVGSGVGIQNPQQYASLANDVQTLNQRLGAYDSDNQLLNTEVASLQQKLQLANQYNQTLKQQLADNSGRIQQTELARQSALQQLAAAQNNPASKTPAQLAGYGGNSAPTRFGGGATIRANNSLMQQLSNIRIPGGQARMDGDVIRIEFPSDRMFVPGTYQVQPAQLPVMQNIVSTILQNFPKQIIGIEAHWDNTPLNPATTTHHQLTATQALAVFDNLVRLGLPKTQMFTMAMASNRPRHPQVITGGISPNRRIELVIYPETYDGSY